MNYYFAPMEGITGHIYRRVHGECFRSPDKYFTPFLVPGTKKIFRNREIQDILPENNPGLTVVPQILTGKSEDFIRGARELQRYGFQEINLNLGCPSGTVVAKGKGSGMLADPDQLEAFLDEIFSALDLKISVKTRIGLEEPEEFSRLLTLFNRFPLVELIVHPRLRKDFYKGKPDLEAFALAVGEQKSPLLQRGSLFKRNGKTVYGAVSVCGQTDAGSGAGGKSRSLNELYGEHGLSKESFLHFHDRLLEEYRGVMSGDKDVLFKMKELWFYMSHLFTSPETYMKKIKKAGSLAVYEEIVHALLREQEIAPKTFYTF
ncbi:MAG: tRNA-dihydrouridine synthase [Blautia sp.]